MTFVALWSPVPTGAGGVADPLADALLAVTPHVVAAEGDEKGRLYWVDARGLPARRVAADALGIAASLWSPRSRRATGRRGW